MVAYVCPASDSGNLPDYATRRKIERQVTRSVHEHILIFTDAGRNTQVWQWVKREVGRPTACREHTFHRSQPGDSLVHKLAAIEFTLEEEESLKDDAVVHYALEGLPSKVLAAEYRLVLPEEQVLAAELKRTQRLLEAHKLVLPER